MSQAKGNQVVQCTEVEIEVFSSKLVSRIGKVKNPLAHMKSYKPGVQLFRFGGNTCSNKMKGLI